jgi:drug/metabolite transporter (DMT)-like permease
MSVVYPLARGVAPVLTSVAAFVLLGEALELMQVTAIGLISFGVLVLSFAAGASNLAVRYACATGVAVAAYSLFGALGIRTAGTVLGFQAGLEIITGAGMVTYALMCRRAGLLQHARQHSVVGIFAGTMSVLGYLAYLAAAKFLPLGQVVALRETSVLFGALIGTLLLREGFGSRRIAAAALVASGVALLGFGR